MRRLAIVVAVVRLLAMAWDAGAQPITLTPLSTHDAGDLRGDDPRIAEINAFDAVGQRIYVVNALASRVDIINASNPNALVGAGSIDLVGLCQAALGPGCPLLPGGEPNSVAVRDSLLAVAVSNPVRTDNGHAVLFELLGAAPPRFLAAIEVGAVPDMITFTEDGAFVLTANEGEPNQNYTIDPPGSVSIIEVGRIGQTGAVRHVGFERFDNPGQQKQLARDGVRVFGPNAPPSLDLEPEYIAIRGDKAYVTLQENNAMAVVNIHGGTVESIVGLGLKDHFLAGGALDPSDQDNAANSLPKINNWPVFGLYQPDAIHAIPGNGLTYLLMANEGDAREYTGTPGYVEALRVNSASYVLDPEVFPNAALLETNAQLGRLNVSKASGDLDGDGDYDRIEVFGARSVSIRDQNGRLVWDSGDFFERLVAQLDAKGITVFNTTSTSNSRDNRSDDKGIEPESIAVGEVNGRPYAFVGLERDGGLIVLDLSNPSSPAYVAYATNRKLPLTGAGAFAACTTANNCGDLGPEGLTFVSASQSPTGKALLIVSNEVSSTTTVWEVD